MYKAAVVLLNWNGRALLEKFLPSVTRYSQNEGCVVVLADNGSTDDSLAFASEHYPEVIQVKLDKNYGFTGGYNRALPMVEAEYYILINTDVEVTEDWLDPLLQYMNSNPDAAACMPKLVAYNDNHKFEYAGAAGGFIDRYGYPFCRGRILSMVEDDNGHYNTPIDIFWATGACMLVRSSVYKQVGGFDESFFAHMEEIDLCWRMKRLGYRIACIPQSTVYHVGGGTLNYASPRKLYLNHRNNLFMLYKNLDEKRFKRTIRRRLLLDGLSAIGYLAGLKFSAFQALWKAHNDYRSAKPRLKEQRKLLLQSAVTDELSGVYPSSIVWKFFTHKKRLIFSQLKF